MPDMLVMKPVWHQARDKVHVFQPTQSSAPHCGHSTRSQMHTSDYKSMLMMIIAHVSVLFCLAHLLFCDDNDDDFIP